ncbi:MAG: ABC transporter permease, partial [Candidatus Aminicenantes bacterium]|nr:ABC transporter permease [Candidatus Aminicenantes bacterium]
KHKGYSFINITGLAAGMACCLLITIWVLDELSYDRFHENAQNLFRVEENQDYSGREYHVNVTPYPLAPVLKDEVPEIEEATRYVGAGGKLLRYGDKVFFENNIRAVDPSFLKMFAFPLNQGSVDSVLETPYSIVISKEMKEKYFGSEDSLGKTISINNEYDFLVTGVLDTLPHNSILQFDFLIPYEFLKSTNETIESFGTNSIQTFVRLQDNVTEVQVNNKIREFLKTRMPQTNTTLLLMPFTRIHLHAYFGWDRDPGAIQYVYIFSIIAMFVLLIACINFMNLSTARSANRAKEVGLRKVVGAQKHHLIRQFYGESVVYAFIALVFAIIFVSILLPVFSKLAGKELTWSVAGIGPLLLGLVILTIFTGVIAGSYPALYLSTFQPVKVLRGGLKSGAASSTFRRILVVVQFSLSILLIIGTTIVYKQLNYMKQKSLGWDKEQLLYVVLRGDIGDSYEALKAELTKDSRILGVTASSHIPTNIGSNSGGADWEGKDPELNVLISTSAVDFDYIETLKIEMAEGRSFSKEYPADLTTSFIVNEETAKIIGKESAVGERFSFMGRNGTIVGVMKNFHFQSVSSAIEPLGIAIIPEYFEFMLIRFAAGDLTASAEYLETTWKRVVPNYPLEFTFIDERVDQMYRTEERIGTLLKYFALLAVLIACLGLFGLASFTAEQRTKEIGIRKILGASAPKITIMLCKEFFILVLVSNAVAIPASYFLMRNWLQGYAFRTSLNGMVFFAAMAGALSIALITVSFQAVRAALANPADSLRYE